MNLDTIDVHSRADVLEVFQPFFPLCKWAIFMWHLVLIVAFQL
jgi:hypothetical protein